MFVHADRCGVDDIVCVRQGRRKIPHGQDFSVREALAETRGQRICTALIKIDPGIGQTSLRNDWQ